MTSRCSHAWSRLKQKTRRHMFIKFEMICVEYLYSLAKMVTKFLLRKPRRIQIKRQSYTYLYEENIYCHYISSAYTYISFLLSYYRAFLNKQHSLLKRTLIGRFENGRFHCLLLAGQKSILSNFCQLNINHYHRQVD